MGRGIMSVSLTASPDFEFDKPRLLFRPSEAIPVPPDMASSNRDANRFVIAVPPLQLRQITLFDRAGNALSTLAQPACYGAVQFSPDGKKVAAVL